MYMLRQSTYYGEYRNSDLPQEILLRIFKYLSMYERKTVKLVCKSWFETCNAFSLLDEELLNCLGIYQLSDTYELLDKSQRTYLSLKFECVTFNYDYLFWEKNGHRIRSIELRNCYFRSGALGKIIICCTNLIHFSLTFTISFAERCAFTESPINVNDLDEILKLGIIRENLESLEIYVGDPCEIDISNYFMTQLFSIFPKVKTLKIKCTNSYPEDIGTVDHIGRDQTDLFNKKEFTLAPVLNYLRAASDRMEKLKLHFHCGEFPMRKFLEIFVALKKLTELSIRMGLRPSIEDVAALQDCSVHLKSLEFQSGNLITEGYDYFLKMLLQTFLSRSSLENLRIRCIGPPFLISKDVFEKLISSGPRNLSLTASSIFIENPESFVPHLISQNTLTPLTNLSLRLHHPQEDSLSFFLQNFPNLYHLELYEVSDRILELLFKYQLKLKTLIVHDCKDGWTIVQDQLEIYKNTFNQLTDVEYLHLPKPVGDIFVKCLSPEPILANLKYLYIEIAEKNLSEINSNLLKAAEAMPFLEGLKIRYEQWVPIDFFMELCSKLSRLRYFCIMANSLSHTVCYTYDRYRQLFSMCPSLRALVHWRNDQLLSYFFDTINKEVLLKRGDGNVVFSKPKVGDGFVEWLELLNCETFRRL